jgi:hypothetical protein
MRNLISSLSKSLAWYVFLTVFALLALALVVSSGAGVIFGAILLALIVLLQLAWLGVGELRKSRDLLAASLEVQLASRDALEWLVNTPPLEPAPLVQTAPVKIATVNPEPAHD